MYADFPRPFVVIFQPEQVAAVVENFQLSCVDYVSSMIEILWGRTETTVDFLADISSRCVCFHMLHLIVALLLAVCVRYNGANVGHYVALISKVFQNIQLLGTIDFVRRFLKRFLRVTFASLGIARAPRSRPGTSAIGILIATQFCTCAFIHVKRC